MTTMTTETILNAGPRKSVSLITACDSADMIREVIKAEADGKARQNLLDAAELRLATLNAEPEPEVQPVSIVEDVSASLTAKMRDALGAVAQGADVTKLHSSIFRGLENREIIDSNGLTERGVAVCEHLGIKTPSPEVPDITSVIAEPTAEEIEAHTEAAPEAAEPEATEDDTDLCAKAFITALTDGNAALVETMIAEVRREGADDAAMAAALINAASGLTARRSGKSRRSPSKKPAGDRADLVGKPMTMTYKGITARGVLNEDGTFTVMAGSEAVIDCPFRPHLRQPIVDDGTLVETDGRMVFERDWNASSISTAGNVVRGRSTNGWAAWKVVE